jgi:hypothetical protein
LSSAGALTVGTGAVTFSLLSDGEAASQTTSPITNTAPPPTASHKPDRPFIWDTARSMEAAFARIGPGLGMSKAAGAGRAIARGGGGASAGAAGGAGRGRLAGAVSTITAAVVALSAGVPISVAPGLCGIEAGGDGTISGTGMLAGWSCAGVIAAGPCTPFLS